MRRLLFFLLLWSIAFADNPVPEWRFSLPSDQREMTRAWSQLAFRGDGRTLVGVGTRPYVPVCQWELKKGSTPKVAPLEGNPDPVTLSPKATWCAAADSQGRVALLDPRSGRVRSQLPDVGFSAAGCAFSPDESTLLVYGQGACVCPLGGEIAWKERFPARCVGTFTSSGKHVLLAHPDGILEQRHLVNGTILQRWDMRNKQSWRRLRTARDGRRLAMLSDDAKNLWLFDMKGNSSRHLLKAGDAQWINDCQFSPDGRLLAVAGTRRVYLFEVGTGRLLDQLKNLSFVQSLCFSPDGSRMAVSTGASVEVYNTI